MKYLANTFIPSLPISATGSRVALAMYAATYQIETTLAYGTNPTQLSQILQTLPSQYPNPPSATLNIGGYVIRKKILKRRFVKC